MIAAKNSCLYMKQCYTYSVKLSSYILSSYILRFQVTNTNIGGGEHGNTEEICMGNYEHFT